MEISVARCSRVAHWTRVEKVSRQSALRFTDIGLLRVETVTSVSGRPHRVAAPNRPAGRNYMLFFFLLGRTVHGF